MTATERLELSRARLRLALSPSQPEQRANASRHRSNAGPEVTLIRAVKSSLDEWWARSMLRPVGQIAYGAASAVVNPLAQRHPFAVVLCAAAAGVTLVWSRPWRWIFGSALFAGFVPQLAWRVVSKLPVASWTTILAAALTRPHRSES